jgi:type 1 glutamine amidotransferase
MIQTLLLAGTNNHDCSRSAPFCKDLMEATGRFAVDLVEDPPSVLVHADTLAAYDLIFSDYNGPEWPEAAKANFVGAVRSGTGLVILHAANNAFDGWVEYEKMCALLWRVGTGHGTYHRFDVTITDPDHPITRGLPPVLKDHSDELYHRLVHLHDAPYHVLATAHSSPESNGTGREEPVLVVSDYGSGRVFHCILGHVWAGGGLDTFESPDFQRVLLRGCEWAATGSVAEQDEAEGGRPSRRPG